MDESLAPIVSSAVERNTNTKMPGSVREEEGGKLLFVVVFSL